jgi:hypothetical protein
MATLLMSGLRSSRYHDLSRLRAASVVDSPWLSILLSAAFTWQPLAAQSPAAPPCDDNLLRLAAPVNGYQQRGNRCEGLYARQVAGTTLFLSSFTESFEKYDLESDDSLLVRWHVPSDSSIQLRAETIRPGRNYRMDARAVPRDTAYRWSNRILRSERIGRSDLGVLGWTRVTVGNRKRLAYVPLAISQKTALSACGPLQIVLSTEVRLTEVLISVAQIDTTGAELRVIKKDEPLQRGFYPAGSPIAIELKRADLAAPGLYSLKVSAVLSPSGSFARDYILLIPRGAACL